MTNPRRRFAATGLVVMAGLGLGACAYDDYGYGGVNVGYGGGYYDDYGPGYYGDYPGYGWYNDYYYPGNGYYVYDRGGRRYRWNDSQRRYWEGRRQHAGRPDRPGGNWQGRPDRPDRPDGNWQGRPDRPDRPGRPGTGAGRPDRPDTGAGRPDRPDRPNRPGGSDWRDRRDAAQGKGLWGAVPPQTRPQMTPRPSSPAQGTYNPQLRTEPRATPSRDRGDRPMRDGRRRNEHPN